MRSLKDNEGLTPVEVNAAFPDGAIIDETNSVAGTAVVREIYNDILVNLYKLIRLTGDETNGIEDSELTSYQLLAAMQRMPNVYNDIQQPMTLASTVFSIPIPIDFLPDKYFIIAKAASAYVDGTGYTFKGSGALSYSLTSPTGFKADDRILLILDQTGVIAISLTDAAASQPDQLTVPFGTPLAYNDSTKVWYQAEGIMFADTPETYDLQAAIRTAASDGTILVYEMLIIGGYVLCLTLSPGNNQYAFYKFTLSNLATAPVLITTTSPGFPIAPGSDNQPFVFTNGTNIYITNHSGASANAYLVDIYAFNLAAGTITGSGSITLDSSNYVKTTNAVIKGGYLYNFISGVITQFNMGTGAYKYGAAFIAYIGVLFTYRGNTYYLPANGDVAKKWSLPVYV